VVGVVTLTWTALKLFRGLDQAFDEVYADDIESSFLDQVKDALVVVVGIGLAVGLVVAVGAALAILPLRDTVRQRPRVACADCRAHCRAPPDLLRAPAGRRDRRRGAPGALVAAVGWVILQVGFRIYAANASRFAAYGIIGAVLLFVTWLYFASIVVLIGAAVNAVRRGVRTEVV